MARKVLILPDEMNRIVEEMSETSGATVSETIRRLIARGLKEYGFTVANTVEWGGKRDGAGKPKREEIPA